MFDLYIIRSEKTGRYYTGSTEDLFRRLQEHNGELPALGHLTIAGRPWTLVFRASYSSRAKALAAERFIKGMKSRKWIEKLVGGEYRLPDF